MPHDSPPDAIAPTALIAAALAQLSEGVIVADAGGHITFVNDAAARLHGVARLDVAPEGYAAAYHLLTEDGRPYPSTELPLARAVLRGETVVEARWRVRRPDGSEVFAVGSARPVLGPAGERLGAVLTVRDDGARVVAERAERRAARILDQVADEHLTMDAGFRILSVNRAAERALGVPAASLIGRTHWEVFPASLGSEAERQYRRVVAERVEAHFAHHYLGEGYDRHIEIDAYPTDEGGVALFWREVSARVRAEEALRERNEALAEQAMELELANQQLQDNAAELEAANDELQAAAATLEERTEESERARAAADAAGRRLAFLAEAGERLASSLDYETTLQQVVALAVPGFADWALYTVDAGDGTLRIVASHHVEPAKDALIREIARRYPIRADEPAGAARVLRTGEPELIPEIPDAVLAAVARDAEHLTMLRAIGFRSLMSVPLTTQGRVLGVLGFVTGESGRLFGPDDLAFAREIARRAATAIDHARLYAEGEAARREAERERARAAAILEAMADGHFVLDAAFRFVSANAAMERGVRIPRERLLGRTIWELFPGTVGTVFERSYRRVVEERVEVHFTGEYAEGELDLVPEVDAYPTPDGGVAVFWRDVASRRRAEAALAESERQFRTLADAIPTLAWTARADGHLDWYNARWYEYTGTTPEQMEGWGWQAVQDPALLPDILARWQASLASGTPLEMTLPLRGADGRFRRFLTRVVPVRDAGGRVLRWFGTNTDVEAERAAREAAEAANAAKSQFLSTMSHELRTPLNAISGYAELLEMGLRGPLADAQRQDLARIRRASLHLTGLVTDVLNFARLDAGQVEYRLVDVELASIVADIEPLLGPQLAARGLAFDHDACASDTPDRPHLVRADAEKLRQILLNLLTNAIKFTEAGGRVAIACETDRSAGVVRVRVSDTGRGIPPDQLERIFEPFVQVDRHRTHESQQGVGLGLAISRDLARGMRGELTAESAVGEGSTFTLTLPLA